MSGAPVRIAVIGAGLIGRRHAERIAASSSAALAAIVDPDPQIPDFGVPVFADLEAMPEAIADAAIIATPNATHEALALACAERGWPVLVEKPIADTVAAARRMDATFRQHGLPLLVGHHRRHHPFVARTAKMLADGMIGEPVLLSTLWAVRKPADYFARGPWRLDAGGGPVLINLIHEIDLMRHLFGDIAQIEAIGGNHVRGGPVEDTAAIAMRFSSGLLASVGLTDAAHTPWSFEAACGENPGIAESGQHAWRICGTAGALEFPTLRVWRSDHHADWSQPLEGHAIAVERADPLARQLEHFVALARGRETTAAVSAADATATLETTLEIARACRGAGTLSNEEGGHHVTA